MQQGFSCGKWFVGKGMRNLLISQNGQLMFWIHCTGNGLCVWFSLRLVC